MSNDGKEFEHLVRLVEQSISPDSVVEHDVDLPVIDSESGRTRQCDVVIRSGQKPRETITIVEVQDRTSKPDINTFEGWLGKLEEVGAQHLICVSRHDFPSSIKEKAIGLGNTVRLITVKELSAENIPMNIIFTDRKFDLQKCGISCVISEAEVEKLGIKDAVNEKLIGLNRMDPNEKCWSLDKNELVSIFILCRDVFVRPVGEKEGVGKLVFDKKEGPELYMFLEGHFFRVGLDCDFSWTFEETEKPISVLSYEQNEAGVLAWVAEISSESPKGLFSAKFPLVEVDEGYRIDRMLVTVPSDVTLTVEVRPK